MFSFCSVWQEVFDNGDEISAATVVHVWKSESGAWRSELERVVKAGQPALLSAPWYLNYIDYGSDWVPFYQSDPHDFNATAQEKSRVIGGEVSRYV
jgi:hexosaminidase